MIDTNRWEGIETCSEKQWQHNNKSSGPKPGREKYLNKENEPLQASRWACPVDHDGQ